jgi:Mlc titration factor MtfA (ptsG expression regulator)
VIRFLAWCRRRERKRPPLSDDERATIERHVPYVRWMPPELRGELEGLVRVFLAEKCFEGCGGLDATEPIRLAVAAQACILLLGRDTAVYPLLSSVLIYPGAFVVPESEILGGIVDETPQERIGESWVHGSVVLSWDDVERHGAGVNVVFHEFAHQLDHESGGDDGTPLLPNAAMNERWRAVMTDAYQALVAAVAAGEPTLLDEYGVESPAEFFAVTTECFFELPHRMRDVHPQLYALLAEFYRQEPACWLPRPAELRRRVRRHPRTRR